MMTTSDGRRGGTCVSSELDFTDTATAKVRAAITLVAREAIHHTADPNGGPIEWEDWPDIGEDDWIAVMAEVARLAASPDRVEFEAAYELLKMRADH